MFGSAFGSFGTVGRYDARASAVRSNRRDPPRSGRAPRPGTRNALGSQNSGCEAAKVEKSSIATSKLAPGLRLLRGGPQGGGAVLEGPSEEVPAMPTTGGANRGAGKGVIRQGRVSSRPASPSPSRANASATSTRMRPG